MTGVQTCALPIMAGMAIAIATTLIYKIEGSASTWGLIVVELGVGGVIGAVIARRIAMTDMPQLVAAFHSLVGMAAVLVAWAAFMAPEAFDIGGVGNIHLNSMIEMSIGVAIGAVTFSGSVIAFAKLQGIMSGAPIMSGIIQLERPTKAGMTAPKTKDSACIVVSWLKKYGWTNCRP